MIGAYYKWEARQFQYSCVCAKPSRLQRRGRSSWLIGHKQAWGFQRREPSGSWLSWQRRWGWPSFSQHMPECIRRACWCPYWWPAKRGAIFTGWAPSHKPCKRPTREATVLSYSCISFFGLGKKKNGRKILYSCVVFSVQRWLKKTQTRGEKA